MSDERQTMKMERAPALDLDLYSDEAIRNPYPLYRDIRDAGAVVWLTRHNAWAVGRFEHVRAALRADSVLVSGHGVAMNEIVNENGRSTLISDGERHRRLRTTLAKPITPRAVRDIEEEVKRLARALVERLLDRGWFDGVADFAQYLPVELVSRLVGLPEEGRRQMLDWAAATFDALGVMNERGQAAMPKLLEMTSYAGRVEEADVLPGGWAARLFEAAHSGKIEPDDVSFMLIDYIAPSLDTTILATGHLLYELGRNPEQWELIRSDPGLIAGAVREAVRLGTPVRAFSRFASSDYTVAGITIPEGDRVLILYASANRDERRYPDPDRFDVTRDSRDHVGFGHGVHRCAGASLAELEMEALLAAMVPRIRSIEVSRPALAMNNVLCGYESFRAMFRAAR